MPEIDHGDWASRWSEGRIGFHQGAVNDFLAKYAERAWGSAPLGRVLVPLCGKSLDMVYLAEHGAEVVGVEYIEQAVTEFFAERELVPEIEREPAIRYSAGEYTLFASDFFEVGAEQTGAIDAVFDRAALVALDADTRVRYAAHLRTLLAAGTPILLITLDYDPAEMDGPPFAVTEEEVGRLFSDGFTVEHLQTREFVPEQFLRDRGLTTMREGAFVITRTGS
jgi:thiopurine S-methyltransferase